VDADLVIAPTDGRSIEAALLRCMSPFGRRMPVLAGADVVLVIELATLIAPVSKQIPC
jgi:hypothetical protein